MRADSPHPSEEWNPGEATEPRQAQGVNADADGKLRRAVHQTIRDVTDDMEKFRFNTMLAKLMTLVNSLYEARSSVSDAAWEEAIQSLLLMLAPSAPHMTEELWTNVLGQPYSIHRRSWPTWDEALAAEDEIKIGVSVNGRPRGELVIPSGLQADEEQIKALALALPRVTPFVEGKTVRRVIYVPGKMLNVVVN